VRIRLLMLFMSAVLLIVTVSWLNCGFSMLFLVFVCYRGLLLRFKLPVMFFAFWCGFLAFLGCWFCCLCVEGWCIVLVFQFLFNFGLFFHTASAVVDLYHFVSNPGIPCAWICNSINIWLLKISTLILVSLRNLVCGREMVGLQFFYCQTFSLSLLPLLGLVNVRTLEKGWIWHTVLWLIWKSRPSTYLIIMLRRRLR